MKEKILNNKQAESIVEYINKNLNDQVKASLEDCKRELRLTKKAIDIHRQSRDLPLMNSLEYDYEDPVLVRIGTWYYENGAIINLFFKEKEGFLLKPAFLGANILVEDGNIELYLDSEEEEVDRLTQISVEDAIRLMKKLMIEFRYCLERCDIPFGDFMLDSNAKMENCFRFDLFTALISLMDRQF